MMRTQVAFFNMVAIELQSRHPVLKSPKNIFEKFLEKIRTINVRGFEPPPTVPMAPPPLRANGIYKNVDLKSPAHQLICEELERRKIMFMWEVNTFLPGDTKSHRRIDLVVIQNFRALIVEIDGKTHRTSQKQYQDDRNRDRLIDNHWNNQIRLEYGEVMDDFRENEGVSIMQKILHRLDPDSGRVR